MKSQDLADLLAELGVARSFSRPRVSDDNAFSEAHFKTLKYQPDYPGVFASPTHARAWCQQFFGWFNDEHQHSGLALFAPADVYHGRVEPIALRRQQALDEAYARHPERFPNGAPVVRRLPSVVSINPIAVDDELIDDVDGITQRWQNAPNATAKTPRRDARAAGVPPLPS